jgi:hypothetical protein
MAGVTTGGGAALLRVLLCLIAAAALIAWLWFFRSSDEEDFGNKSTGSSSSSSREEFASSTTTTTTTSTTPTVAEAATAATTCPRSDLERAVRQAFKDVLGVEATGDEVDAYVQRLDGIETTSKSKDACYNMALSMARKYLERAGVVSVTSKQHDAKDNSTVHNTKADKQDSEFVTAADALLMYESIMGRPPGPAMQELLELKIAKAGGTMTRESLKEFLLGLRDAGDVGHQRQHHHQQEFRDPLYAGLQVTSRTEPDAERQALRSAVCDGTSNGPYDGGETLLADALQKRNQMGLINLCKRSQGQSAKTESNLNAARVRSAAEAGDWMSAAGGCASPEGCGDGSSWIRSAPIRSTPLDEAAQGTLVGSIMPRFVYAEYV